MKETEETMAPEEQEFDLVELIQKLWKGKKVILRFVVIAGILGILVGIFSGEEYTAQCTIVPQTAEKGVKSNLSGLAAMAGISLGNSDGDEGVSPRIYSRILVSVPFQKELMQTPIKFEDHAEPVRLIDYYTDKKYQSFSVGTLILKYTIGLPGLIINSIRGEDKNLIEKYNDSLIVVESVSRDENRCMKALKQKVTLTLNEKDGYINLVAVMSEPLAAAQLTSRVQFLLQKYITEFKIAKTRANLEFIEERCEEAKNDFDRKQRELAAFRDGNQGLVSAMARTGEERLTNEYNLAFGVYSELAKQREQANIRVKETTPVFMVVDPVTIPTERSKPQKTMILVMFMFLGAFVGMGWIIAGPFVRKILKKDWGE